MQQTDALVTTIKRQLKAQGKTYADVAKALSLSEASVKRLFAERNFTLHRLDSLCRLLSLDLVELVQLMERGQSKTAQLTIEQEQEIAEDPLLLLITVCVINGISVDEILTQYRIDESELIRKLVRLDRLNIIELLPGNRTRLLITRNFSWHANGPIQQFFLTYALNDFFRSRFDRDTEELLVVNGLLTNTENHLLQNKMRRLTREFDELASQKTGSAADKKFGTTLVVAVRPWRYSLFDQYARE